MNPKKSLKGKFMQWNYCQRMNVVSTPPLQGWLELGTHSSNNVRGTWVWKSSYTVLPSVPRTCRVSKQEADFLLGNSQYSAGLGSI